MKRLTLAVGLLALPVMRTARAGVPDAPAPSPAATLWSLQPVRPVAPPAVRHAAHVRSPIDAFLLAEMAAKGIEPGPAANRATLLRRASFDLIGLPPSPEEVDAFVSDPSPNAFATVVERLLASPHYGERWGRHWLDLARYAESEGFKDDGPRPDAWRYRDYVIKAFNDDKPYDRFVREQVAGDELWPDDPAARVATGFNRHYPDEWNARNLPQRRQDILNDMTDTVGAVFTGLTFACARCHDHKYDPISHADYYRLQAFFANTAAADQVPLLDAPALRTYREKLAAWEDKTKDIRAEISRLEEPRRKAVIKEYVDKYPPETQAILNKPAGQRTPFERQMAAKAAQYVDPTSYAYIAPSSRLRNELGEKDKQRWAELNKQLNAFESLHPGELPVGTGVSDLGPDAPKTYVLNGGAYDGMKDEVQPGVLSVLDASPAAVVRPANLGSTGRRTALANWLTDPRNPLTARVMVNRVWHYHFGRGIVGTPSDFGAKGDAPTHPALLDWLAGEFVRSGWSVKQLHRTIMSSAAYQQSSASRPEAAAVDPDNRLLWRFPRQRLEAEIVRDAGLAVAGLLNAKAGGPSVFPELPPGMANRNGLWKVSPEPAERNRRSVYVFVRRNNRYPLFESFDAPDTLESCARRNVTTTPLQALSMLNNPLTLDWARHFAGRVLREAGSTGGAARDAWTTAAFRIAYARPPGEDEARTIGAFYDDQRAILAARTDAGGKLALPGGLPEGVDPLDAAALVDLCHTLLNSNEFVYRN